MTVQPIDRQPQPSRDEPIFGSYPPLQPGLPAPGGTTTTTGSVIPTTTDLGGLAFLRALFASIFGGALANLADRYWQAYVEGMPFEQIVEEIRRSPEHETVFAGFSKAKAKDPTFNEAKWLALRNDYVANYREFGVRSTFFDDPEDFRALVEGEQTPREHRRRLELWSVYDRETRDPVAEQEIRRYFARLGMEATDGDFLMFAMNPDRATTALERALTGGLVATEAQRAGFGALSVDEGLRLADLGVDRERARSGFDLLGNARELLAPLPGEAGDTIERDAQLGLVAGTDAAARRRLERQQRRRLSEFAGGGGISSGSGAFTGLAPA